MGALNCSAIKNFHYNKANTGNLAIYAARKCPAINNIHHYKANTEKALYGSTEMSSDQQFPLQ